METKQKKMELSSPLHPMLVRSYTLLESMFLEHIVPESGHGLLATPAKWEPFLDSIPHIAHPVKTALLEKWSNDSAMGPEERWADLKKHLQIFVHGAASTTKSASKKSRKDSDFSPSDKIMLDQWPIATVFKYCYPRLDVAVSKGRDHLLKSPFCVHPKTGRVCVPIDIKRIEQFDPEDVPTLAQVVADLDSYAETDKDNKMAGWRNTRLTDYFDPFEKDFLKPVLKDVARLERNQKEKEAAAAIDF
jgi:DNA primase small subunit